MGTLKIKVGGIVYSIPRGPKGADGVDGVGAPVGSMMMYGGAAAPSGFLLCQGQSLSTTTYADLFAILGYTYGGSAGNFNLPDMRVRVPIGAGTGKALGATDGLAEASRDSGHSHSHSHSASESLAGPSISVSGGALTGAISDYTGSTTVTANTGPPASTSTSASGAATSHGSSNHSHNFNTTANIGHGHSHSLSVSAISASQNSHSHGVGVNTNSTPLSSGQAGHPFAVVNYIIKT